MTDVPFLDLGAATAELGDELEAAALRVIRSGWYVLGDELAAFEREWATACGCAEPAVGVGSGLDALRLALQAAGVGPGDEVVVPAHTFVASWLAVSETGATPVAAEVDPATMLLDPEAARAAIGPRTRALMPVHLYGQLAPVEALRALADEHGLLLLEDAAQAHGATRHGAPAGTHGDAAAWSFYPGKNLGALGDAGAVTTRDAALADAVRLRRNYGSRVKYEHEVEGINSRLDELQAALLRVKLAHLADWNRRRRGIAQRYLDALGGLDGLTLPVVADGNEHVWHLFVVHVAERDRVAAQLATAGIGTLVHYPIPPHRTAVYAGASTVAFPLTDRLADEVLSLPIGPQMSDDQVEHVVDAVRAALA